MEIKDMNPILPDGRRATLEYLFSIRGKIILKKEFRDFGSDIARGDFSNIKRIYNIPGHPADFMQNPVSAGESIGDKPVYYPYALDHELDWVGCDAPGAEFEKKYHEDTGLLTFGCTMKYGDPVADMASFIDYFAEEIIHLEIFDGALYYTLIRDDVVTWISQSFCRHRGIVIPTRFVNSLENETYPIIKKITDPEKRRYVVSDTLRTLDGYRGCTYNQENWDRYEQELMIM